MERSDSDSSLGLKNCPSCGADVAIVNGVRFCPQCGAALVESRLIVELAGVWKSFSGNPVLRGVDLSVPAGESLVIVGMSGSGKSVLMEHIIGFQRPDRGKVIVDGMELSAGHNQARTHSLLKRLRSLKT